MAIELAYINTKHPDFTEAVYIHKTLTEGGESDRRKMPVVNSEPVKLRQSVGMAEERVSYDCVVYKFSFPCCLAKFDFGKDMSFGIVCSFNT